MTCEISIMNRYAIALAADSAATVTEWVGDEEQKRFFKGTNKIFQLSNHHPVGIMIFGTATLHEVPWELIIKEFRKQLDAKSFNSLGGYASDLFDFMKGHGELYPEEYQARIFREEATKAAFFNLYLARRADSVKSAGDTDRPKAYQEFFAERERKIDGLPLPAEFDAADVERALAIHKLALESELQEHIVNVGVKDEVDPGQLANVAVKSLLKQYKRLMSSTGVVVAGFGDKDYFPAYEEYICYGLLLGKVLSEKKSEQKIDVSTPAHIKPFATTAMVDTFLAGISPDLLGKVHDEFAGGLKTLAEKIKGELNLAEIPNLADHVEKTLEMHTSNWTTTALEAHVWPLRRVIGSLPVDEMAGLAETLIMLQSLKEKFTQPTESVGGPIDVAVITKGDGFVWIKRKHYFDPKLNPRFFLRQEGQVQKP